MKEIFEMKEIFVVGADFVFVCDTATLVGTD